jgi:uncharacterized membrane protein
MRVRFLITLFLLAAFVLTQGTSLAASICHHASVQGHIAARESHDSRKAFVAFAEEAAGSVASKKGATSHGASTPAPPDLLTPPAPTAVVLVQASTFPRATDGPPLAGLSLRPPLPPPLA